MPQYSSQWAASSRIRHHNRTHSLKKLNTINQNWATNTVSTTNIVRAPRLSPAMSSQNYTKEILSEIIRTTTRQDNVTSISIHQRWCHSDRAQWLMWWLRRSKCHLTTTQTSCLMDNHPPIEALRFHPTTKRTSSMTLIPSPKWLQVSAASVPRTRTVGKERSRQNCANSGLVDLSVRTSTRNRDVVLPMDRKNFKRRRVWATNTWPQYARTS